MFNGWIMGLIALLQYLPIVNSIEDIDNALNFPEGSQPMYEKVIKKYIYDCMTEEEKEFVKLTSVAVEMNEELCNWITGRNDSNTLLSKLAFEKRNFFFSFDSHGLWYRCHDLLRDYLRNLLHTNIKLEQQALIKAGKYYKSKEKWQLALTSLIIASAFEEASSLLLAHFEDFFYPRGLHDTVLDCIDKLLIENSIDLKAIAYYHYMKGSIFERRGNRYDAFECISRSVDYFISTGDLYTASRAIKKLGMIKFRQRKYLEAKEYFLESYKMSVTIGDKKIQAQSLYTLGDLYRNIGQYEEAIGYLNESFKIMQNMVNLEGQTIIEVMLGKVDKDQGRYVQAHTHFMASKQLNAEIEDIFGTQVSQSFLGEISLLRGDFDEALEYFRQSLQSSTNMGNRLGIAINDKLIGEILTYKGDVSAGNVYLLDAIKLNSELSDNRGRALTLLTLSLVSSHKNDFDEALSKLYEAFTLLADIDDKLSKGRILIQQCEILAYIGRTEEAISSLERSQTILSKSKGTVIDTFIKRANGIVYRQKQEYRTGILELNDALKAFRTIGAKYEVARTHLELAISYDLIDDRVNLRYHLDQSQNLISNYGYGYLRNIWDTLAKKL